MAKPFIHFYNVGGRHIHSTCLITDDLTVDNFEATAQKALSHPMVRIGWNGTFRHAGYIAGIFSFGPLGGLWLITEPVGGLSHPTPPRLDGFAYDPLMRANSAALNDRENTNPSIVIVESEAHHG